LVISSSRSSALGGAPQHFHRARAHGQLFLVSVRVISLDKKLVQVNDQKLCVVVFVVNEFALRFRAGFTRSTLRRSEASNEAGFPGLGAQSRAKDVPWSLPVTTKKER
jgi:hypothetical protein